MSEKKRKLTVGKFHRMESIKILEDWWENEGVIAKSTETNPGLAKRDYSVKCYSGSSPLMVVEGFWIWWCFSHNHPLAWCDRDKGDILLKESLQREIELTKLIESLSLRDYLTDTGTPFLVESVKKILVEHNHHLFR